MVEYKRHGIIVRTSVADDVQSLKGRLRPEDHQEIIASGCGSVEDTLAHGFNHSTLRYTVELHGVPVAMFGIVPETILGDKAVVWFLGAPEMAQIKKSFVRLSRHFIDKFLTHYSCLWNLVDSRYTASVNWLRFCGATFHKVQAVGDVDFICFSFGRK